MDIDCSPATVFHGVGPVVIVDAVAKNIVFADNSDLHIFTSRRVCPFRKKKAVPSSRNAGYLLIFIKRSCQVAWFCKVIDARIYFRFCKQQHAQPT